MKDNLFIASFLFTILVILIVFFSPGARTRSGINQEDAAQGFFEQVDTQRLEALIDAGKLSDKEAMYYTVIDESP